MGTAAAPHTLQDEFSATLGLSGGTTHLTRRISGDFGVRRWHHTPYNSSFQRLWGAAATPHTLQDEFSATLWLSGGTTHLTRRISGDFGVRRWHHTPYKMSFQRLWGAAATPRTLLNEFQLTLGRDDSFIR